MTAAEYLKYGAYLCKYYEDKANDDCSDECPFHKRNQELYKSTGNIIRPKIYKSIIISQPLNKPKIKPNNLSRPFKHESFTLLFIAPIISVQTINTTIAILIPAIISVITLFSIKSSNKGEK